MARHVRLNQPHSVGLKPSWYGESVGHYEGNTLIVDTIGLNDRTFVDSFRTPHTSQLHVVERFRITDGGKGGPNRWSKCDSFPVGGELTRVPTTIVVTPNDVAQHKADGFPGVLAAKAIRAHFKAPVANGEWTDEFMEISSMVADRDPALNDWLRDARRARRYVVKQPVVLHLPRLWDRAHHDGEPGRAGRRAGPRERRRGARAVAGVGGGQGRAARTRAAHGQSATRRSPSGRRLGSRALAGTGHRAGSESDSQDDRYRAHIPRG